MFFDRTLRNAKLSCHVPLRQAAQLAQYENLAAAIRQPLYKGGDMFQFLPVRQDALGIRRCLGDVQYLGMSQRIYHDDARATKRPKYDGFCNLEEVVARGIDMIDAIKCGENCVTFLDNIVDIHAPAG